jgi:hypothetical protein
MTSILRMVIGMVCAAMVACLLVGCARSPASGPGEEIENPDAKLVPLHGNSFIPSADWKVMAASQNGWETLNPVYVYACPPVKGRRVAAEGNYAVPSPDGNWVAYVNRGVCVVSADGKQHWRLTDAPGRVDVFSPGLTWSPDGKFIMYGAKDGGGFNVVSLDGKIHRRLLGRKPSLDRAFWLTIGGESGLIVWIKPDASAMIAFTAPRGAAATSQSAPPDAFAGSYLGHFYERQQMITIRAGPTMVLDLKAMRVISFAGSGQPGVLSPDAKWLAFFDNSEGLTITALDGTRRVRIRGYGSPQAWSGDGKWIYVMQGDAGQAGSMGTILAIDWQRKVVRELLRYSAGSPRYDDKASCFRFHEPGGPEWGAERVEAWVAPDADPLVVNVWWPRRGRITLQRRPEVSIADQVFDVEPQPPEVLGVHLIRFTPGDEPLPVSVKQLPVQTLELTP